MSTEKKNRLALHWQVIIGLVAGALFATVAVIFGFHDFVTDWINPFGKIFINLLKLIAVPLVLFSIIVGVASLGDITKLGKLGWKTLGIYLLTTVCAVSLGLLIVNVWEPGEKPSEDVRLEYRIDYELWKTDANNSGKEIQDLDNLCYSCDPANSAIVEKIKGKKENVTQLEEKEKAGTLTLEEKSQLAAIRNVNKKLDQAAKTKGDGPLQPLVDVFPPNIFKALTSAEMLQIIFFGIFFGIMLLKLPREKYTSVYNVIDGLNDVFVNMIMAIMKAMPYFVFALMAGQVVEVAGNDISKLVDLFVFLLHYSGAVLLGLLILIFIIYPLLVSRLVKSMTYMKFMNGMRNAQITAFSTSSSVATLPVTMDCVENEIGVSERTTSFVLPIGATVNMDGTSLYQAVAVVAMAQLHMVDLTFTQQLIIVATASLASIGAAAIPSAGLVLMIMVLESVGLNGAWIALIIPVDRILDMFRTVVNVTGDGAVSTLVAASEGELEE